MAKKQKYYVVWHGKQLGIYTDWDACKAQVQGVQGAQYKAFDTMAEAQGKAGDGGHLAQPQAVGYGVLQVAHLGLAARARAAALALVRALLYLQRYVIFLRNALADLLELVADVLPVCHSDDNNAVILNLLYAVGEAVEAGDAEVGEAVGGAVGVGLGVEGGDEGDADGGVLRPDERE